MMETGRDDWLPNGFQTDQSGNLNRTVQMAIVPAATREGDILVFVASIILPLILRGADPPMSEDSFLEASRSSERTQDIMDWETQEFELVGPALFRGTKLLTHIRSKENPWSVDFVLR